MFCSPAGEDLPAGEALDFRLESPLLQHHAAGGGVVPQRAGGPTTRTEGRPEPTTLAGGRTQKLLSQQAGSRDESVQTEGVVALRGGARDLAATAAATSAPVEVEVDAQADAGWCDPYDGGDEWCEAAISTAEQRALTIQGTNMYCRWVSCLVLKATTRALLGTVTANEGRNKHFSEDDDPFSCYYVILVRVQTCLCFSVRFLASLSRCLARVHILGSLTRSRSFLPSAVSLPLCNRTLEDTTRSVSLLNSSFPVFFSHALQPRVRRPRCSVVQHFR